MSVKKNQPVSLTEDLMGLNILGNPPEGTGEFPWITEALRKLCWNMVRIFQDRQREIDIDSEQKLIEMARGSFKSMCALMCKYGAERSTFEIYCCLEGIALMLENIEINRSIYYAPIVLLCSDVLKKVDALSGGVSSVEYSTSNSVNSVLNPFFDEVAIKEKYGQDLSPQKFTKYANLEVGDEVFFRKEGNISSAVVVQNDGTSITLEEKNDGGIVITKYTLENLDRDYRGTDFVSKKR